MGLLSVLDWLDLRDGSIVALATLALVAVTIWYARTTARLLEEARKQRAILSAQALSQVLQARADSGREQLLAAYDNNATVAHATLKPVRDQVKSDNERAAKFIADLETMYGDATATSSKNKELPAAPRE